MDADEIRTLLARLTERVQAVFQQVVNEIRRLTAPLVAAWAHLAIERWERLRAYFASHPDLAEFDDWLDRWYSFGTA